MLQSILSISVFFELFALKQGIVNASPQNARPIIIIPITTKRDFTIAKVIGNGGHGPSPAKNHKKTKAFIEAGQAASTLTGVIQVGTPPQPMVMRLSILTSF